MAKLFCPKCMKKKIKVLTFSIRYLKDKTWLKPTGNLRYCENCDSMSPENSCVTGHFHDREDLAIPKEVN